jgi:hypothetical protein
MNARTVRSAQGDTVMNSSDADSARDDLAYLRSLVEDDWRPGLWAFGAIYATVGITLVAHVLISWGAASGYLPLRGASLVGAYVALYAVASLIWTWIGGKVRRHVQSGAAAASVKGRAGGVALMSTFLGHLVMLAVFVIVAVRQRNGVFLELAPLVLFTLQSVTWFVVHAMRRQRWQLVVSWGWLVAVLALAPLVGTSAFGAGIAVTAIVLMVVPGVHMMRAAHKA